MDLSNLKPAAGATKKGKRIGRGQGSGRGGTSTKGHNGQKSRSGASIPAWFEGGQMPLTRRIPKFGFKNRNRIAYKALNLSVLEAAIEAGNLKAGSISIGDLVSAGVAKKKDLIKILANGEVTKPLKIEAHKCSASAQAKIEAAGGSVTIIDRYAGEDAVAESKPKAAKAKPAAKPKASTDEPEADKE